MKKITLTCLFCVLAFCGYGQVRKTVYGDTAGVYHGFQEIADKLKMPRLIKSKDSFYFRFWNDRQDEKKEFNAYARQIKRVFKKIGFDFVHSEIPYWVHLQFDNNAGRVKIE